jgi:hypothetical protein
VMKTKVKAHPRKGTRGVRRHLRIVPNTSRPVPKVRIYFRERNPSLIRRILDAGLDDRKVSAFSVFQPVGELEPRVIYLRSEPPKEIPITMADVMGHEDLHDVLEHEVGHSANLKLDNIANFENLQQSRTHRGMIPDR